MGKISIVDINGHYYRYIYEDGQTRYLGPVGSSPPLSEEEFLKLSLNDEIAYIESMKEHLPGWSIDHRPGEVQMIPSDPDIPIIKIERGDGDIQVLGNQEMPHVDARDFNKAFEMAQSLSLIYQSD
jgi:hypothetical protein